MQKRFHKTVLLFLAQCIVAVAFAQEQQDVMLKALTDEIATNMKELSLPMYDRPFFMLYNVSDQKNCFITASLGALGQSHDVPVRVKNNTRVLVGDYTFNDESLEDNLFSQSNAQEINLPVDNDYYGIRRAFWSTTDKVYRDAAKHYSKHKEDLKELGKTIDDVPHRSFAKSEAITMISSESFPEFDKSRWERIVRNLSAIFLNHPEVEQSQIMFQYTRGFKYIVTSEGTSVKVPISLVGVMALAEMKNQDGEFVVDRVIYQMRNPAQLPREEQMTAEIEKMIVRMKATRSVPKFTGEYTGPVLLIGRAVPELFSNVLLRGRESITASHAIPTLHGPKYDHELTSMEGKIGKNIFSDYLTIKAKPKLLSYDGLDLLGAFAIDDEGIVPPDEVTVIQNGVLKNLLNDRTLSHPSHTANGFSSGAGVLEISSSQKSNEKILKDKLIAQAKKDGLDYGIIIRDEGVNMGVRVYKVSIVDGKEELLRNAIPNENMRVLKHVLGASDEVKAFNLVVARGSQGIVSFIAPNALLLEEMDIKPLRMPSLKDEEYVSNPLLGTK